VQRRATGALIDIGVSFFDGLIFEMNRSSGDAWDTNSPMERTALAAGSRKVSESRDRRSRKRDTFPYAESRQLERTLNFPEGDWGVEALLRDAGYSVPRAQTQPTRLLECATV
jgi:hypothetical protein